MASSESAPLSSSSSSLSAAVSAFPNRRHRVPAWSPQRANNAATVDKLQELLGRLPAGWRMVDLRDSAELRERYLDRFYDECMIPNFPDKDELDDLDFWLSMFEDDYEISVLHILIIVTDKDAIAAGVVTEYFPHCECGLLSYLLVQPSFRGSKPSLARVVTDASLYVIDIDAQTINRPGVRYYFCETNSPLCVADSQDVISPTRRVATFNSLNFRLVEFNYVQPPLSDLQRPATYLLLLVYNRDPDDPLLVVDAPTLRTFLRDYANSLGASDFGVDFNNTMTALAERQQVTVSNLLDFLERHKADIHALNASRPKASL